jgi:hypothetical protein
VLQLWALRYYPADIEQINFNQQESLNWHLLLLPIKIGNINKMQIIHKIDDFLFTIFPELTRGGGRQ